MWVVGVVSLLVLLAVGLVFLNSEKRSELPSPLWNLSEIAGHYTDISGILAGFSVASAVFIAASAREAPGFTDAIGLFIVSFLILIAATMEFGTTPNLSDRVTPSTIRDQQLSYLTANFSFYLGTALSWLGLRLVLLSIEQSRLAELVTWLLLVSVWAGSAR